MIINHPGRAHIDELIADSLILHRYPKNTLVRRKPTTEDYKDPETWVVDVGQYHEPKMRNFGHHQIDHKENMCAFRLVASFFGLDDLMSEYYEWYLPYAMIDCQGVDITAQTNQTTSKVIHRFSSPLHKYLIRAFEKDPSSVLDLLISFGGDLIKEIETYKKRRALFVRHLRVFQIGDAVGLLFPCRVSEATFGLAEYQRRFYPQASFSVTVDLPANRWSMFQFTKDCPLVFEKIANRAEIEFVAPKGFLAKTKKLCKYKKLIDLLQETT